MTKEEKTVRSVSLSQIKMTKKQKLELIEDTNGELQFLARIGGVVVTAFEFADKQSGEVRTGFKGIFKMRTRDDDVFASSVCYLPKQLEKQILASIRDGAQNLAFQYDVSLVESKKSGTGYAYTVEPVLSDEAKSKADKLLADLFTVSLPKTSTKAISKKAA